MQATSPVDLRALASALGHPRTPWYARVWITLVVAYALSPLDLIPDLIPILGLLDDVLLLPLGILLAIRLIPADVLEECRRAPARATSRTLAIVGTMLVALVWIACAWASGAGSRDFANECGRHRLRRYTASSSRAR